MDTIKSGGKKNIYYIAVLVRSKTWPERHRRPLKTEWTIKTHVTYTPGAPEGIVARDNRTAHAEGKKNNDKNDKKKNDKTTSRGITRARINPRIRRSPACFPATTDTAATRGLRRTRVIRCYAYIPLWILIRTCPFSGCENFAFSPKKKVRKKKKPGLVRRGQNLLRVFFSLPQTYCGVGDDNNNIFTRDPTRTTMF